MNRTLAWLLAILVGLDVVLRLNAERIEVYEVDNARESFVKMDAYRAPDLALLGSSRADVGLKNDVFKGRRALGVEAAAVYNLGVAHGGVLSWMFARNTVLRQPPKAAILGTSMFELNGSYQDPGVALLRPRDYLAYCRLRFGLEQTWQWAVSQADLGLDRTWRLYRYRKALELLAYDAVGRLVPRLRANAFTLTQRQKEKRKQALAAVDGWRSIYLDTNLEDLKKEPGFRARYKNLENFHVGAVNKALYEQVVDGLLERGVKVALAHIPVSKTMHEASYTPAMWAEYTGYLEELARSRGIPFILLSREDCGLTDADFSDLDHLTPAGAEKFSRRLLRELERIK